MTEPLVSILVPTYNGERFLKPALRSALDQSHRAIEVIVGDDASTDRTPEILESIAAADDRVRVVRHERNLGGFGNPVRLLELATGEYVKFLLHDDVLATDCVRELVRGMQSTPDATLAFSRRALVDENGRPVPGHEFARLSDRPGRLDGRELGDLMLGTCTNLVGELTTVLFRRADVDTETLWQVDGRRLEILGDLSLWLRLLTGGAAFYTPRVLSRFRVHAEQSSQNSRLITRGIRDWPRLIDWGARNGFLAADAQQRVAHARALQIAAARVAELAAEDDVGPALDAVFLSTARLLELGADRPLDGGRSLPERAHGGDVLALLGQELDVWTGRLPLALAAPEPEAGEVRATVEALREVHAAGAADRLVLAFPEAVVDHAAALVGEALSHGSDVDLELVPTDDPAHLLTDGFLAVAPRGSDWHVGTAAPVWWFDLPSEPSART